VHCAQKHFNKIIQKNSRHFWSFVKEKLRKFNSISYDQPVNQIIIKISNAFTDYFSSVNVDLKSFSAHQSLIVLPEFILIINVSSLYIILLSEVFESISNTGFDSTKALTHPIGQSLN